MVLGDISQVSLLWQEAPHKTNSIFDRTAFVTVERFAEVGSGSKDFVSAHMLGILRPVIISDGQPELRRIATESSG
jgi:hypothetical protein